MQINFSLVQIHNYKFLFCALCSLLDDPGSMDARSPSQSGKKVKRFEKFRLDRSQSNAQKRLELRSQDLYLLIEVEELKYLMEVGKSTILLPSCLLFAVS